MLSWVNDVLALGHLMTSNKFKWNCRVLLLLRVSVRSRSIGNKVDAVHHNDGMPRIKIIQPVFVQKIWDEFDCLVENHQGYWQCLVRSWSSVIEVMHLVHKMHPCTALGWLLYVQNAVVQT